MDSLPQPIREPNIEYTKLFINNEWVDSVSGESIDVINPSTGKVICKVSAGQKEDIDKAVKAARAAFHYKSPWRTMIHSERAKLIYRLADLMERDHLILASLETLNCGKPFNLSYIVDVGLAIKIFRYFGGWATKLQGKTLPVDGDYFAYTSHEPVGVCGQIIPWNFPMILLAWKLGPALATGCTTVLKPSEMTPLTANYVAQLVKEAGFPMGVVNVVSGYGKQAGEALVLHPEVDKISFTGSTAVGLQIGQNCYKGTVKRLTLELGGKSPVIVMDDVNVKEAVEVAHSGMFFNKGETCCAGTRIYVHEKIYDEFVSLAVERAKNQTVGDPFTSPEQGPQISEVQMNRILGYIEKGKSEGAKIMTGGSRIGTEGYYIEPTVFVDVQDQMTIAKEEIFGPVMCIIKFKSLDEAIDKANDTCYGLAAGVLTKNIETALYLSKHIRAGSVWINCYNVLDAALPFGGFKMSGLGREVGEYSLQAYTEVKAVTVKVSPPQN